MLTVVKWSGLQESMSKYSTKCINMFVCMSQCLIYWLKSTLWLIIGRRDTQHNDTQYNDTQHNDTKYNDTQPKDLSDTRHNRPSAGLFTRLGTKKSVLGLNYR